MGKKITYLCDDCQDKKYEIINDQDRFPPGWYSSISNMRRSVRILCPDCYKKMCMHDNGFLRGATKEELWNTKKMLHKYGFLGGD